VVARAASGIGLDVERSGRQVLDPAAPLADEVVVSARRRVEAREAIGEVENADPPADGDFGTPCRG